MKIDSVNVLGTDYEIVPEIAPLFSTSQAYAVGDCVIKNAVLYKFIAAHSAGAWNAAHVQAVQPIGKQVVELGGDVAQLNERIGDTVKYTEQSLTDSQKLQARENIGANAYSVNPVGLDDDLVLSDGNGNVIASFADGHILTKEFDSSKISENLTIKTVDITSESDELYISDPNGNVLAEYKRDRLLRKRIVGKKISIEGDSISTFAGAIPAGYEAFYPRNGYGINSVNDMWYSIAANRVGAEVLISASWGGATICGDSLDPTGKVMCSTERINALAVNGVSPDIIIVFGGINDFSHDYEVGTFDYNSELPSEGTITVFSTAYALMLHKIMTKYPNALVYCCTILPREMPADRVVPIKNGNGDTTATFNVAIRHVAEYFGANVISFDRCGITYYNNEIYTDTLHPYANGHVLMAEEAVRELTK